MRASIKGLIITAAFIGPGTVTTATVVGSQTAYALIWLLLFAVVSTYILQEMASRLGTVSGLGLSQAIMTSLRNPILKIIVIVLIVLAIGVGNAAYEGGNLTGAALGMQASFGSTIQYWTLILGGSAFALILIGHYKLVEKCLILLVVLMSIVFIAMMFVVGIETDLLTQGILVKNSILSQASLALAIVGTTIVPYNLFLHSGLSAQDTVNKRRLVGPNYITDKSELAAQNAQLFTAIGLGGLVTFAIMSSSVTAFFVTQTEVDVSNLAKQLQPLLGDQAGMFFGIGLFCAGLTSAITAPLAAAYAISGLFGFRPELADKRFKFIALLIVVVGVVVASLGIKPIALIIMAQASNAILLPISVILLIWVCNKEDLVGEHKNGLIKNILAIFIVMLVIGLSVFKFVDI